MTRLGIVTVAPHGRPASMATAQASQELQLGFPAKGSLKRFPFPRLIREIARANLTGSLYLLSGQTKKVVFFEAGQPVFVRSNVLSECLGQVLAQEGLITQEQCEQTLEAIRRTGKKQGELLVEMGILSQGNLRYGLQAQLRAKLFDIFSWDDGRYQFKIEPNTQSFGVRLDTPAEGVILAAIQDRYPEDRARAALGDTSAQFPTVRGELAQMGLELSPEEKWFVGCLDGSRTLASVLEHGGDPPVPYPAALLFGLLQAGAIALVDEPQPARPHGQRPTFVPTAGSDDAFAPAFEAQDVVTEYEDTPLPGELPKVRGLLGDHEADFAGVEDEDASGGGPTLHSVSSVRPKPELPQALVAAEPAGVEETFEGALEFSEDSGAVAMDEFDFGEEFESPAPPAGLAAVPAPEPAPAPEPVPEPVPTPMPATLTPVPVAPESFEPGPALEGPPLVAPESVEPIEPAAIYEMNPADIETLAEPSGVGPRPDRRDGARSDPDATVLDSGLSARDMMPISTDRVGDDLLAEDELDSIHIGGDDLVGLELDEPVDELALPYRDGAGSHELAPEDLGITPEAIDADLEIEEEGEPLDHPADELIGFDELDAIDLGGAAPAGNAPQYQGSEATMEEDENPEMLGAVRFNEAEAALGQGDFAGAVSLLEEAYESGFDVAELHAMLAYARFMAAGQDADTAQHALELLDYAQTMDPSLDLVHAYRGAIYRGLRQPARAREALDRALELNPYCELAMQIMDTL